MTESSFRSITPDGITGMLFTLEGIRDAVVLLNGPMGCRFYHSSTSGFLMQRPLLYLKGEEGGEKIPVDHNYLNDWFFRQERVPCTYLDGYDYVYGTKEKVSEAVAFLKDNIQLSLLAVVNSPGASLIGDPLEEALAPITAEKPVVVLESSGYSTSFSEGAGEAELALLKQVGEQLWRQTQPSPSGRKRTDTKRINLLGLSVWQRYCEGDIRELKRLFTLCGLEVGAVLCADCSLGDIAAIPEAGLNAVLCPEAGLPAARYLNERLAMPYYVCDPMPVGFAATEKMFAGICGMLGVSAAPVTDDSGRARGLAWNRLNAYYQRYGKPKGTTFHVAAEPSLKKAYTEFLTRYLGMEETGADRAELLFSDANRIAEQAAQGRRFCGIEIAFPGMGYTDLTVKTHMGVEGALFLIEQVLNGIMSN